VIRINVSTIPHRFWLSASSVVAVTLVVVVLLGFLAMGNGFRQTLKGSGADDVAIVLRSGSSAELNSVIRKEQLRLFDEAPGIAKRADGKPLISAELYVVVDGKKRSDGSKGNLPLRGVDENALDVRRGIKIVEGRMFTPGSAELVVGRSLGREYEGFELGQKVKLSTGTWTVVGIFDAGGSVFESEIWCDINSVQTMFQRNNVYQTLRARLENPAALEALKAYNDGDARLKLDVKSEAEYYAAQAKRSSDLIQRLGWPLAIAMAIGALAGALNTMYSSVATRAREIATLRAIGFGGLPAFAGTLAESMVLAAIGGIVGTLVTWAFFDGLSASTLGSSFTQVVFTFKLSPELVVQGLILALAVGFIGGLFPAIRAARLPIVQGLSE